jgi:cobalt-zinc-cadmium efflux system outer membrane protein
MKKCDLKRKCSSGQAKVAASLLLLFHVHFAHSNEAEIIRDLPTAVSIHQLMKIVREKSPRYASAQTQIETAQAEVTAAGVLPNPKVSYGRFDQAGGRLNTQFDGPSQQNITVEVPLLIAGQRGARKTAAERRVEVSEADVEIEYTHLIRETWRLFVQLLAGQERVIALENAHRELERLKNIISGKESAGTASRYDVLRITQETRSLETRLENARTEMIGIVGQIDVLLGFPGWKFQASGTLTPIGTSEDIQALWRLAELNNPELEGVQRETIAADAGLERARRERWPVPSILFGTAFTDQPYGNTLFSGFSVELPLFDRGQGGMARASAAQHAVLLKRELLMAATRQELERAVEVLKLRRETLTKFERDVLETLPTLKQMAEDAYRLGKTGLLELLDSSRTRTEIKLNHLELLVGEIEAELDAMLASGILVAMVPP